MTPERALETVEVFTDGACLGNPGPGGWVVTVNGVSQGFVAPPPGPGR